MGKYDHVTWCTAPNQLDNSFSAVVWGLLRVKWVLLGAVQASASSAPCPCFHCLCGKAQSRFKSKILGENKQGRQTDCQCVGLVFTRSTLGSIRKSLVPLNHRFLNQAPGVLWVMDLYNLCQCLVVEFPDAFREGFFLSRVLLPWPWRESTFSASAEPVSSASSFPNFLSPKQELTQVDLVAGLVNLSGSKCCFSEV